MSPMRETTVFLAQNSDWSVGCDSALNANKRLVGPAWQLLRADQSSNCRSHPSCRRSNSVPAMHEAQQHFGCAASGAIQFISLYYHPTVPSSAFQCREFNCKSREEMRSTSSLNAPTLNTPTWHAARTLCGRSGTTTGFPVVVRIPRRPAGQRH